MTIICLVIKAIFETAFISGLIVSTVTLYGFVGLLADKIGTKRER